MVNTLVQLPDQRTDVLCRDLHEESLPLSSEAGGILHTFQKKFLRFVKVPRKSLGLLHWESTWVAAFMGVTKP